MTSVIGWWAEAFVIPAGVSSTEEFGTAVVTWGATNLAPTGIASAEAFGTTSVVLMWQFITPTGIASAQAFGTTHVNLSLVSTGIASAEAFGTTVVGRGAVSVTPTGIASAAAFGTTVVGRGTVTAAPTGIASAEAFGTTVVAVAPLALSITGSNVANATSVTIPTHAVGDLIVIFARKGNGLPSIPSSGGTVPAWSAIDTSSSSYAGCRTARFIATATNHTSGTWTGADGMIAVVLRNAKASGPIGGHALSAQGATANTCPGATITLSEDDGTSIILKFYGYGDAANSVTSISSAPSGHTRQVTGTYSANKVALCLNTKDSSTSDSATAQPSSTSCWSWGASVEVLQTT